ncbi:MAG: hypothetical protein ACI9KN_001583, partial [Gammaproteobacteria bacterium]
MSETRILCDQTQTVTVLATPNSTIAESEELFDHHGDRYSP